MRMSDLFIIMISVRNLHRSVNFQYYIYMVRQVSRFSEENSEIRSWVIWMWQLWWQRPSLFIWFGQNSQNKNKKLKKSYIDVYLTVMQPERHRRDHIWAKPHYDQTKPDSVRLDIRILYQCNTSESWSNSIFTCVITNTKGDNMILFVMAQLYRHRVCECGRAHAFPVHVRLSERGLD